MDGNTMPLREVSSLRKQRRAAIVLANEGEKMASRNN